MNDLQKILIVDDDLINIILFENILQQLNVEFIRALSGEEAVVKAKENDLSLALVDVHMPGFDGYETVKNIRKDSRYKSLPVIFFSAVYSENYYAVKGLETGAVDFITKPVIPEILKEKVKIFLELEKERTERIKLITKLEKANKKLQSEIDYRKIAESKLLDAKNKAEQSEKLKTAFLANMSHEIRTPMNAIIGFADLLLDNDLTDEQRKKYVSIIKTNSNSLLTLINDIIDLAKIESDQLEIKKIPVKINLILNELHLFYRTEIQKHSKDKNIELKLKPAFVNPGFSIITDPSRLKQILNNLLSNAVKFTEKGVIEFGYEIIGNKTIEFFVKDTGIGIPADKKEQIFERFTQLEHKKIPLNGGTGLGLAITKKLIKMLNGEIRVESKPGSYSHFFISLPYEIKNESEPAGTEPVPLNIKKINWQNSTILVVEDVESNYLLIEAALKRTKVRLIWVKKGEDAVKQVKKNSKINLVLMDIRLHGQNGIEATKKIKEIRPDLPVVAQTAYAFEEDTKKMIEAGCNDTLTKPLKTKELFRILSKYLKTVS